MNRREFVWSSESGNVQKLDAHNAVAFVKVKDHPWTHLFGFNDSVLVEAKFRYRERRVRLTLQGP